MAKTNFDEFKGKDCVFVADWLKTKGLRRLCSVFEGVLERFMFLVYKYVLSNHRFRSIGVSNGLCEQCGFFLRARAVINFLMRAANTLEITKGEQRALCKFSTSWNLSLLKRCFAPSNLADILKAGLRSQS